jgi:hypothetical protein
MTELIVALMSEISTEEIMLYQEMGYNGAINYDTGLKKLVVTMWRK